MTAQPAAAVEAKQADREQADGRRLLPKLAMLDRPLTSYHLIIGTTGLLLAIGLVMVLVHLVGEPAVRRAGRPTACSPSS